MATNTNFPNGIETTELLASGDIDVTGDIAVGGDASIAGIVTGNTAKDITVDCTSDVTLADDEKNATFIDIEDSGSSKTLVLGMTAGQVVVIKNSGSSNDVTVKNKSGDTGVTATATKTAMFLVTSAEPIKLTADV